jgi:hypothetical protein
MFTDTFMRQEQFPGIIFPAQHFFVWQKVVDAGMAVFANPQAAFAHFFYREPPAEPVLAVTVSWNEMVERQESTCTFAKLTLAFHSILVCLEHGLRKVARTVGLAILATEDAAVRRNLSITRHDRRNPP